MLIKDLGLNFRIYPPISFQWPSMAVEKNSRKRESMKHMLLKQKVVNVGKLISYKNRLDKEITCLVLPTASVHLILSRANKSCDYGWSRENGSSIYTLTHSPI